MRVGFTGTRRLDEKGKKLVEELIASMTEDDELVVGACVGADIYAAQCAIASGHPVHAVVPAIRKLVAPDWPKYSTSFELMRPDTSYRERNAKIVSLSRRIIAVAEYPEQHDKSIRSGTWQTVRIGRRWHKPVDVRIQNEG